MSGEVLSYRWGVVVVAPSMRRCSSCGVVTVRPSPLPCVHCAGGEQLWIDPTELTLEIPTRAAVPNAPRREYDDVAHAGERVELLRWVGSEPQLVAGMLDRADALCWVVAGVEYSRAEWTEVLAD